MNSCILRKYLSIYSNNQSYNVLDEVIRNRKYDFNEYNIDSNNDNRIESNLFCERICDDLCELILSYLTIEDKLRLESVCKQFQRCIYNKQFVIELRNCENRNNALNILNCLVCKTNTKYIDIKVFECLLKKCRFCNEILMKSFCIANKEDVLKTIIICCHYLKSISFDFNDISAQTVYAFGIKFGPNLKKLSFVSPNPTKNVQNYSLLFQLCPNLISLNKVKLKFLIANREQLLTKLKEINLFFGKTDVKFVKPFVESHKNSLKTITINSDLNYELFNVFLKEVPNFKSLEVLEIFSTNRMLNIDTEFVKNLKLIGNECKHLKRFKLMSNKVNQMIATKIFESINAFKSLKCLDIRLLYRLKPSDGQYLVIKSIQNCKRLESIQLNCSAIDDRLFREIHIPFTCLRRLCLTVEQITDSALKALSKLKTLQYLSFDVHHSRSVGFPLVTDVGLCDLIYHSPNIESIVFYGRPNITNVTINALILLALSKPKQKFNHYFGYIERKFSTEYTPIELAFVNNMPKNLIISTEMNTYFS